VCRETRSIGAHLYTSTTGHRASSASRGSLPWPCLLVQEARSARKLGIVRAASACVVSRANVGGGLRDGELEMVAGLRHSAKVAIMWCNMATDVLSDQVMSTPAVTRRLRHGIAGQETVVVLTLPHPGAAEHADLRGGGVSSPAATPVEAPPPGYLHGVTPTREVDGNEPVPSAAEAESRPVPRIGRAEPCPCGSGRKYKSTSDVTAARDRPVWAARWGVRTRGRNAGWSSVVKHRSPVLGRFSANC
jgi:SEC-C motif